ncbi:MAG TPA: 4-alpha-glucanotransferase, partial [Gemmatimonadaceae bacterium]
LTLPVDLPMGYHDVSLSLSAAGKEWTSDQTLIVVPPRCVVPDDLLDGGNGFGIVANLYTLRSAGNWGVGDLRDLRAVARWAGEHGADFIGVNPLHALLNRGSDVSPYSPVSRIFRNPIYLDVDAVPELEHAPELRALLDGPEVRAQLAALRESPAVRYEQVMAVKGIALDALHRVFVDRVRDSGSARAREYEEFVRAHSPAIDAYATWMAIAEHQANGSAGGERHAAFDWRHWPDELRDSASPSVKAFAREHAARVDFHRWVQFELDRQIGETAACAREAGMRVGLYQDLAIGTSPSGVDPWANPGLFVHGVHVGAPPDPYSATGQDWGLPPIDPRKLREDRYRYFVRLVRSALRHAGALRIDHVMGLFRLFWIPEGRSGEHGAYVRYPSEDLLGILALESARHGALVVGEDLGTVPSDVPPALQKWGVLSSKVLYFERTKRGGFKSAGSYPRLALATANTHDMAPVAGFWAERDVDLRRQVGLIRGDAAEAGVRAERARERKALLRRLTADGILPRPSEPETIAELRGAVHEFLCRTPSQLVGLSLDDLAGELDPVNVPGVGPDRFASWTRKMRLTVEEITTSDDVRAALHCGNRGRAGAV